VLGFVFLGEALSGWQLMGALLVLASVFLVQRAAADAGRRQPVKVDALS
jgi:probable blue pigment (indigoidine) exporter